MAGGDRHGAEDEAAGLLDAFLARSVNAETVEIEAATEKAGA